MSRLQKDALSRAVTHEAIHHLDTLFGSVNATGTRMAIRATERLEDPAVIAASCEALAQEVLASLAPRRSPPA